jgi:hypothetical protein
VTHHEKDFGDYLEEVIIKIDGAIEQYNSMIRNLNSDHYIGTLNRISQTADYQATICGLYLAKNILLGRD